MANGAPTRKPAGVAVPAPQMVCFATSLSLRVPDEQPFPKPMMELVVEAGDLLLQVVIPASSLEKLGEGIPEAVAAASRAHTFKRSGVVVPGNGRG